MIHSDGYIELRHSEVRGSSRLYRQSWHPDSDSRAAIIIVHGLGEHSSRYAHVAQQLTDRHITVHTLDHYGHGKSDGHAGHVPRFSVFLDGVAALLKEIRSEQPDLPLFLLGHSMGGLIAARFLLNHQAEFRAAALSGPAFATEEAPPAIVLWINRVLSALLPTLPMIALDGTLVSRDPTVVEAYLNDPLVHHGKLTSRLIAELSAAMDDTLARAADVRLPLLVMHGELDRLTAPSGSIAFHASASSPDKTLKTYPGLFHEIFNEPEQDAVLADLGNWLEEHL
ncbi:MAG: alpha/beta hydrolase [Woeseiaceae bacterium]|nr:alpha/beta hydrolase [Woeseiaceae bacterium]